MIKAFVYQAYGSADVLKLQEIPKPTLKSDDDVLVKIYAVAINPADWRMMRAQPFLARLDGGLFKPKNNILGQDIAGVVEAVGKNVKQFKIGDKVFGELFEARGGGFAEYVTVSAKALAPIPNHATFEQAASIPLAGITALQGLRDYGQIQPGQHVLINGASGGVGTFAIQIAKVFGTEVTGVCSTRNLDLVRSIGADHVIDYTKQSFTDGKNQYDLILDMVGNQKINHLKHCLKEDGVCVVGGFHSLGQLFHMIVGGALASRRGKQKFGQLTSLNPNSDDLLWLKKHVESGKITPIIEKTYSFEQLPDAIRHLETGRARGKIVITVTEEQSIMAQ